MFGRKSQVTPAQRQVGDLIFDETIQVLSTFELNRIASLTYGEMVCDEVFEILENVLSAPMEHSILVVQKSLVIAKHILVYGSEKCINSSIALRRPINALLEFNTVLWAQNTEGASGLWNRLKGGNVDKVKFSGVVSLIIVAIQYASFMFLLFGIKGYPVREAAKNVHPLLFDLEKLRALRNSKADPNSLVPIGNNEVGFASDEVRHYTLKKRIEEQFKIHTKSNLAKAEDGFGAGYSSRDGKAVVGAAHSLEEMMKHADMEKNKFSDEGKFGTYEVPQLADLSELRNGSHAPTSDEGDLLWSSNGRQNNSQPVGDLLDFSAHVISEPARASSSDVDFLGTSYDGSGDLLGNTSGQVDIILTSNPRGDTHYMGVGTTSPFSHLDSSSHVGASDRVADPFSLMNPLGDNSKNQSAQPNSQKKSIMASNEDRFAALDALQAPETTAKKGNPILSSARDAKNRLLGLGARSGESRIPEPEINITSVYGTSEPSSADSYGTDMTSAINTAFSSMPAFGDTGYNTDAVNPTLASSMQGLSLKNNIMRDNSGDSYGVSAGGGGLRVAQVTWDNAGYDDDGFVMGGTMGSGLEPTTEAPAAAPPPPPPI